MASFLSLAWLLLLSAAVLLQLHPAHSARIVPKHEGQARMGAHYPGRGRTVRYRVDGRRPEAYFADASVVRRGRPTHFPRGQLSSYMDTVSAPVMRATGGMAASTSEPRTVRNFMNRFRSLLISPINRLTGMSL